MLREIGGRRIHRDRMLGAAQELAGAIDHAGPGAAGSDIDGDEQIGRSP